MFALIGVILSSIFRGNNGDGLLVLTIMEICLVDWWLLPLIFIYLSKH